MRGLVRSGAFLLVSCSMVVTTAPAWALPQKPAWTAWVHRISTVQAGYVADAKKLIGDVGSSKASAIADDALRISGDSGAIAKLNDSPSPSLNKMVYSWAVDMEAVAVYSLAYSKSQTQAHLKQVVTMMYACTAQQNAITKWYAAFVKAQS